MSRPTTINLPALDLPKPSPLRTRGRSSSLLKVDERKDRSVEDALDRSAYLNITADWVNAKGPSFCLLSNQFCPHI